MAVFSLGPLHYASSYIPKARIFLLVDLWEFVFRFRVGETEKKSNENDQSTGHWSFSLLFFYSESFFLISPEKNCKTNMANTNSLY